MIEGVDYTVGSGNVFADTGCKNPEELQRKADLARAIRRIIKERGYTQQQAAKIMGTTQPQVSAIMGGLIRSMSADRLMNYLDALGVKTRFVHEEREPAHAVEPDRELVHA